MNDLSCTMDALPAPRPVCKFIAFSLWGMNPRYVNGAFANIELARIHYPDWKCVFYVPYGYDFDTQGRLAEQGAIVITAPRVDAEANTWSGLFWRLSIACTGAERWMIRDCDSRINEREANAVLEWERSGLHFHVIRDHSYHTCPIMGGLWGGCRDIVHMEDLVAEWPQRFSYFDDQIFLAEKVWPLISHSVIELGDGPECINIKPKGQLDNGAEFCGQRHNENGKPEKA